MTAYAAQAGKVTAENNFLLTLIAPPPPVAGQMTPQTKANAAITQKLDAAVKEFGRDIVNKCLTGGDCPVVAQVAISSIIAMIGHGESEPVHTGNNDQIDIGPWHTGNNIGLVDADPNHTGNNQSSGQGVTNTGNTEGAPNTGGNITLTPIPDGLSKDDLAYLAEGDRPPNLSPEGAARAGAFNEAKKQSGIPVSQSPSKVSPNVDKRGNAQPGYIYEFDVPKAGGGVQKVYIRDDAGGHIYKDDSSQNRGPQFNDEKDNHYDY